LTVTLEQVADAVRILAHRGHVIAEGAGAAALAAARNGLGHVEPPIERVVCIVSGGNIDSSVLATILSGSIP
jgi:threonine dehydratase